MKRVLALIIALLASLSVAFAAVNVNTATQAELESLNGIGPAKAKAIIDYRTKNGPFKSGAYSGLITVEGPQTTGTPGATITAGSTGTAGSTVTAGATGTPGAGCNVTGTGAISILSNGFQPSSITVAAGTSVTWTNNAGDRARIRDINHVLFDSDDLHESITS